ncbi:HNH endonuclease signature motif containing protein [Chelativorans sp.]|uniref:HNH endonuclease signature motif containing protein n=1 Tax=Chelativorans sp. TaxID=2203393 RepID=UPI002810CC2D|nr:HNH endonuclease signature motif containing protein [Chelativorans sp.]
MTRLCSVEGCGKAAYCTQTVCRNHWLALKRYGNTGRMRDQSCVHCGVIYRTNEPKSVHCSELCRFEEKVDKSAGHGPDGTCWQWTGTKHGKGYGHFSSGQGSARVVDKAHRVAFRLYCDHEPGNLLVCHTCDNPACVNPDHLFLATNTVNLLDRQKKERQARGEMAGRARLRADEVRAMRAGKKEAIERARSRGVSDSAIRQALRGDSWRHLNSDAPPIRPTR